jgi:3-methylfumaryl-CoA hydratase
MTAVDIDDLRKSLGNTQTHDDTINAATMARFAATLDREEPWPADGDATPPATHWVHFTPYDVQSQIGPDGHPFRGSFLPPVPLPRRMWAGGEVKFVKPLRVGEAVQRVSEVASVDLKEGKTGSLVFVTVKHTVSDSDGVAIEENQNIVYRDNPDPTAPPPPARPAPGEAVWQRTVTPDPVMLFRYSAMTFNGHRIHYDYPYVTEEEGYPGLVVHGPLLATLLLDLCRRQRPDVPVATFDYRAVSPTYCQGSFSVEGEPDGDGAAKVWIMNAEGALAMVADATFAP